MKNVMKNKFTIYIALFLVICLIPSAGLIFTGVQQESEGKEAAKAPKLFTKDAPNPHFLSDAGKWYEDHFAFRSQAVTGYAQLLGNVFGESAQGNVIMGKDGWLFYKDSLADFQGTQPMTDRQLFDVAHTLAMMQAYAKAHGAKFVFVVAPNKNSLYGEYMPDYYQPADTGESNFLRLKEYLKDEQVNYIDLYETFYKDGHKDGRILYHKRDSHWNNEGAAIAADQILEGLGKEHDSYADRPYDIRKDFQGDLEGMLYPAAITPEEEVYYHPAPQFDYCKKVENNFAPKIHTRASGSGGLLMYRDSFGNALLPFLAEAFESAYFSRALPYRLNELDEQEADALVIERAERFLPDMASQAPEMEAVALDLNLNLNDSVLKSAIKTDVKTKARGEYIQVSGTLPSGSYKERSRIYVRVNGEESYEAFPVSVADHTEGFSMFLRKEKLQEKGFSFEIFVSDSDQAAFFINEAGKPNESGKTNESGKPEDAGKGDANGKTELRREDYPDCDGSGHGYREIYYSDGSVEIEEY